MSIVKPQKDSHKGENGRVLVIGGSKLFHASIFWSAEIASRIVDIVHFSSPAMENNDLVRARVKSKMYSGIVVPFEKVDEYIEEDDSILIGPGMPRDDGLMEGERPTGEIVDEFVGKYPEKRWVIDGGALQEIDHTLLGSKMIITPHQKEWERLIARAKSNDYVIDDWDNTDERAEKIKNFSQDHDGVCVLSKGVVDIVVEGEKVEKISGGNQGLTKGGSGDVLAGIVSGFYSKSQAFDSCIMASRCVKVAGDRLYEKQDVFYNTSDLIEMLPQVMKELI